MKAKLKKVYVSSIIISLVFINLNGYAKINPEDAAAIWLFDEGTGKKALDSSENHNDAFFNGNPKWVEGKFGKAIWFDGTDDYLSAKDSDSLDVVGEAITLLAWIKADGWPASWNHVIRKTVPASPAPYFYILGVHSNAKPFIYLVTDAKEYNDIQGKKSLPTKEWIHLAMTYNGKEITIYVNGERDATSPAEGTIVPNEGELRIGRGNPAGYFTGAIDEAAVFRTALSQNNIKAMMKDGLRRILEVSPQGKLASRWAAIKIGRH